MTGYKNFGLFGKIDNNGVTPVRSGGKDATFSAENEEYSLPDFSFAPKKEESDVFVQKVSGINADCLIRHRRLSSCISDRNLPK